ncbi:MAG: EAL domain-containing protein [Synechococcus sp.]|nr:EAL domain-containing protein [Synechococcus sp.]
MATPAPLTQRFTEAQLAQAIALRQFGVVYQPQVNPHSGLLTGFEALLRWHHPQLGMISPNLFIPMAETTGLIIPLGAWVLDQAIAQLKQWQNRYRQDLQMSVNVSVKQIIAPDFLRRLQDTLAAHKVAPQHLELEITESTFIEDFQDVRPVLEFIQDLGIRLAIDDFGTGYASFNYARLFHWDVLKLDRCFIRNLHHNAVNAAITKHIINMSHELGFAVVAEGIEFPEELAVLQQYCCDRVQGYYLGRPLIAPLIESCCFASNAFLDMAIYCVA